MRAADEGGDALGVGLPEAQDRTKQIGDEKRFEHEMRVRFVEVERDQLRGYGGRWKGVEAGRRGSWDVKDSVRGR